MNIDQVNAFARERMQLHESNREEIDSVMDDYWDRLAKFIASDIPAAIDFMVNSSDCTGEIFSDWSEVFEDVVAATQSKDFLDSLPIAARRFPMECAIYNISDAIEIARAELND